MIADSKAAKMPYDGRIQFYEFRELAIREFMDRALQAPAEVPERILAVGEITYRSANVTDGSEGAS